MLYFQDLSEAQKFYYTKQMLRVRDLVQAMRPNLTPTSKDQIIANRLSRELGQRLDIEFVRTCRGFAKAKTDNPECTTMEFDSKKNDYLRTINKDLKNKAKEKNQSAKNLEEKESDFDKYEGLHQRARSKKTGAKTMFWTGVITVCTVVIGSFSTILATLTSFVFGLSFVSAAVFGLGVYFGAKTFKSVLWPKIKGIYKSGFEALDDAITKTAEAAKTAEEDAIKARTENIALEEEYAGIKKSTDSELEVLAEYKNNTDIENGMHAAIEELTELSKTSIEALPAKKEIDETVKNKRMKQIRQVERYYVSLINYKVIREEISTGAELNDLLSEAKTMIIDARENPRNFEEADINFEEKINEIQELEGII